MLPKIIYATERRDGTERWIDAGRDFRVFEHGDIVGVYQLTVTTRKVVTKTLETLPTKSRQRKVKAAK